ncbi:hypothetical protein J6590_090973 [Homalodisca vitripennis]|nr:hypothetical protein J6590_090973 [Homalodisca vitripennis]
MAQLTTVTSSQMPETKAKWENIIPVGFAVQRCPRQQRKYNTAPPLHKLGAVTFTLVALTISSRVRSLTVSQTTTKVRYSATSTQTWGCYIHTRSANAIIPVGFAVQRCPRQQRKYNTAPPLHKLGVVTFTLVALTILFQSGSQSNGVPDNNESTIQRHLYTNLGLLHSHS